MVKALDTRPFLFSKKIDNCFIIMKLRDDNLIIFFILIIRLRAISMNRVANPIHAYKKKPVR